MDYCKALVIQFFLPVLVEYHTNFQSIYLISTSLLAFRFNSYDGRLDRELEAVVLMMEAFVGFEDKLQYDILGHSGESHKIVFVDRKQPPQHNKDRLDILKVTMFYIKQLLLLSLSIVVILDNACSFAVLLGG